MSHWCATNKNRREKERKDHRRLYMMARKIQTQEQLNSILLDVPNRLQRGAIYDLLRPMIHCFTPDYPIEVSTPHAREGYKDLDVSTAIHQVHIR